MTFLQDWMKYLTQYAVISFEKKSVPSIEGFSWRNLRKWFPACASIQFDGRLSDKSPCWEQKTLVKDHQWQWFPKPPPHLTCALFELLRKQKRISYAAVIVMEVVIPETLVSRFMATLIGS
jgi:hypothetical protein